MYVLDDLMNRSGGTWQNLDVPRFYIPNWPRLPGPVTVHLGERECSVLCWEDGNGLLRIRTETMSLTFLIAHDGSILIMTHPAWMLDGGHMQSSASSSPYVRMLVLLLFDQFKEEIFEEVRRRFNEYEDVAERIRKAFEPFLPYAVADRLSQ